MNRKHGEYKVPGGKLVVVDLAVDGDLLRDVEVSGDFFLEPAEALSSITEALEGAPANAGVYGWAQRISAGMPEEAQMIGFSAEAVATAVQRAVEGGDA